MTFLERYQRATEGYAIHASDPAHTDCEGHFSWSPCETCNCKLGGNRYCYVLTNPGKPKAPLVKVKSCTDCIMYAANGVLPEEDA